VDKEAIAAAEAEHREAITVDVAVTGAEVGEVVPADVEEAEDGEADGFTGEVKAQSKGAPRSESSTVMRISGKPTHASLPVVTSWLSRKVVPITAHLKGQMGKVQHVGIWCCQIIPKLRK
jgi:hypothetical protein